MRISLGPAPLSLGRGRLLKFYKAAVKNRFDDFYIGEVSCLERGAKSKDLLLDIARLIKDSGKNLFISTYALVTKMNQIEDARDLLQYADGLEVNNLAFLELHFDKDLIAGSFLNIYNWQSANYLAGLGFKRALLPQELTSESIIDIAKNSELEVEIVFRGRKTLAISRRCYYLRALDLNDDECKMNCFERPDGLTLNELFRINGKEILSEEIHSLDGELPLLKNSGVGVLRFEYENFK